jgi:hypothetical protein
MKTVRFLAAFGIGASVWALAIAGFMGMRP